MKRQTAVDWLVDNVWTAIPRDKYINYWNNDDVKGVLKSKNIDTLIEMITKDIKV